MKYIINVLPKYPLPKRFCPPGWADWYLQCRKAVQIQRSLIARGHLCELLIVSDAKYEGWRAEPEIYKEVLQELGAEHIRIDPDCFDTISQLKKAVVIAKNEHKHLIVLATWMHFLRAKWLLRGAGAMLRVSWGVPYWRYAVMDILLTFFVPFCDLTGLRPWYLAYAKKKRDAGKVY